MKILNFGSCNIDYVYNVPHFVQAGETLSATQFSKFVGGKGLNQSIAISKSGENVCHAGCIGKDGQMLSETLREAGVDIRYLKAIEKPTGHAIIQVNKAGENCIMIYGGANLSVEKTYIDEVLSNFKKGDILLLQNEINNLEYIIDKAYNIGMKVILNPSPVNSVLKSIDYNKISILVMNEVEALELSGESVYDKICAYFKERYPLIKLVLTLGKKGSIYFNCKTGGAVYQPAFSVEVKDTTAAGDTFTGYFISGVVKGLSPKEVLKLASAASALAVSKNGTSASIPEICDVEKAMNILKPYPAFTDDREINVIYEYINDNLTSASLGGLAKNLKYSESYTAVKVKQLIGIPFTKLLQRERCKKAEQLFRESDLPIEEIIKNVGYDNGSFFRKTFKEIYGKTPLEYRFFYRKGHKSK